MTFSCHWNALPLGPVMQSFGCQSENLSKTWCDGLCETYATMLMCRHCNWSFQHFVFQGVSTSGDRAHCFCLHLLRASDDAYEVFINALLADGQNHVARELRDVEAGGYVVLTWPQTATKTIITLLWLCYCSAISLSQAFGQWEHTFHLKAAVSLAERLAADRHVLISASGFLCGRLESRQFLSFLSWAPVTNMV